MFCVSSRSETVLKNLRLGILFALLVGFHATHGTPATRTTLPPGVLNALAKHKIPQQHVGVFVQEVSSDTPLLAVGEDRPLNPASVLKLLTTFVALDVLGPAYTLRTEAYADGPIVNGRLDGNLTLKGYGDPLLVTEAFWKFVRGIKDRGLRHIGGDLIVDNTFFETVPEARGNFDGKPYRAYNAEPDALMLNFHAIRFDFLPDTRSGRVDIVANPTLANLLIDNRLKLIAGPCRNRQYRTRMKIMEVEGSRTVRFAGQYPATCGEHAIHRLVTEPALQVYGAFASLWRELGGRLDGGLRAAPVAANARLFHTVESRPLAELVRGMNKFSNNVMTRQLLLILAAERYGAPGTAEKGKAAIREWLTRNRIDATGLTLENGAGRSRRARITARTLGELLLKAYASPTMPEFVASLPIASVDGTMRRRFRNESMSGRAHIKTGTLDDVSAMGGYILSRRGARFVVVAMSNHRRVNAGAGRQIEDALARWVFER